MKKLALALVCLVSVAFFASCDPENVIENPEPAISILAEEGYLYDGQVIDLNVDYPYGFTAASNAETGKELARLVITSGDVTLCDTAISGTEFTYRGYVSFSNEDSRDIIGSAEIIATVTDVAGKTNKAMIKVDINESVNLVASPFIWVRANGADGTGLDEYGLKWTKNLKDRTNAVIEPVEGATLYEVPAEKWDEVVTAADKAALFSDGGVATPIKDYRGVNMAATAEYNDVIATLYNGEYHLIHITKCTVETRYYVFSIMGEAK